MKSRAYVRIKNPCVFSIFVAIKVLENDGVSISLIEQMEDIVQIDDVLVDDIRNQPHIAKIQGIYPP